MQIQRKKHRFLPRLLLQLVGANSVHPQPCMRIARIDRPVSLRPSRRGRYASPASNTHRTDQASVHISQCSLCHPAGFCEHGILRLFAACHPLDDGTSTHVAHESSPVGTNKGPFGGAQRGSHGGIAANWPLMSSTLTGTVARALDSPSQELSATQVTTH